MKQWPILFILNLLLFGCNSQRSEGLISRDMEMAIDQTGVELGAESVLLKRAALETGKPIDESVHIKFSNCKNVVLDSVNWIRITELILERTLENCSHKDSLPKFIRIELDEGFGNAKWNSRRNYVRGFNQELIIETYNHFHSANYLFDKQFNGLLDKEDYDKAIKLSDSIIELNSDQIQGYPYRGLAYYKAGDTSNAISDFRQAVQIDSLDMHSRLNLAYIFSQSNQFSLALLHVDTVIQLDQKNAKAVFYRGMFNYQRGDTTIGCDDIQKAKEMGFTDGAMDFFFNCN